MEKLKSLVSEVLLSTKPKKPATKLAKFLSELKVSNTIIPPEPLAEELRKVLLKMVDSYEKGQVIYSYGSEDKQAEKKSITEMTFEKVLRFFHTKPTGNMEPWTPAVQDAVKNYVNQVMKKLKHEFPNMIKLKLGNLHIWRLWEDRGKQKSRWDDYLEHVSDSVKYLKQIFSLYGKKTDYLQTAEKYLDNLKMSGRSSQERRENMLKIMVILDSIDYVSLGWDSQKTDEIKKLLGEEKAFLMNSLMEMDK